MLRWPWLRRMFTLVGNEMMKIKVKCLNDLENGTWEFSSGEEYYYDDYSGAVVGDNYIPVFCYICDDGRIIAAIKETLSFEILEH